MRILIADKFPESYVAEFKSLGMAVEYKPDLSADTLEAAAEGFEILVVRSTKVSRNAIAKGRQLELILRAGAGVDTIDVVAASERGIYVANCPGKNSVAVAELTMGLITALDRRIPQGTADLKRGAWNKKEYSKADGLKGQTLGIVGFGAIGQAVAKRAAAFEMSLIAYSVPEEPYVLAAHGTRPCGSLFDLAEQADIVTVHVPQGPDTKKLFGVEFFARMKQHAMFINTSRGGVVDQAALERAMKEKVLRVGLDVFDPEPAEAAGKFTGDIASQDAFVGTHHIGASTDQAQNAIAAEAVRICREFATLGHVPNCVNIERHTPAKVQLLVRHYDKVGVLAEVLGAIRNNGLNVEDMTNTIFAGSKAAVAVIRLSAAPPEALIQEIGGLQDKVIQVSAKAC
jgi:D-3-phosphoglycerate dehydrogenase / 2-oxoglutarate reductase